MLLRIWQNIQSLEDVLADHNSYRMYSTIVTEGLNFTMIPPDTNTNPNQTILDIDQVRILSMSHKYKPSGVHVGLLIYSVDGQTDFILNHSMLRIKAGDILIHRIHHALTGHEEAYRDLIRTVFGTHRINLTGLVFTFSGDGQYNEYYKWSPSSSKHISPIHPTEQKLLEMTLISLYMNHAWLSMPITTHIDVETLSQSTKKQYLLKLGELEQLFYRQRKDRQRLQQYFPISKLLRRSRSGSSDNFRSFQWTPSREQTFDIAIQTLLDGFYTLIQQTFQDGEFDPDQYAYFDDSTQQLAAAFVNTYPRLQPVPNYYSLRQNFS